MIFDTHAHYTDSQFDDDRFELLNKMPENNVGLILNACSQLSEMPAIIDMADKYDYVYGAVGIHPEAVDTINATYLDEIKAFAEHPKIVAIGEIGLDYYWTTDTKEKQQKILGEQIDLARELGLPVIIHDREAHGDCLEIVKNYTDVKILFHCYSGSCEMLREILKMGMYISMGGVVTFKNARKTVEVIELLKDIPDGKSRLLLETDCPYLAPVPHRGELNHSGLMHNTAQKIAELLGTTKEEIIKLTYDNAIKFYGIKE